MNKQIVVHSYNMILHSNAKEHTTDTHKYMDESPMCSPKWKKPDLMADTVWFHLYSTLEEVQLQELISDQYLQGPGSIGEEK